MTYKLPWPYGAPPLSIPTVGLPNPPQPSPQDWSPALARAAPGSGAGTEPRAVEARGTLVLDIREALGPWVQGPYAHGLNIRVALGPRALYMGVLLPLL